MLFSFFFFGSLAAPSPSSHDVSSETEIYRSFESYSWLRCPCISCEHFTVQNFYRREHLKGVNSASIYWMPLRLLPGLYVGAWSWILAFKGENINSRVFQGCFVSIFQSNLGFWRNKVPWILDFLPRICGSNGRQRPHAHATSTCVCLADLHINERASFDLITVSPCLVGWKLEIWLL